MADTQTIQRLFRSELIVVNVGPKSFADVLEKQGYQALQVDWRPAAGGDREMQKMLEYLGGWE